MSNYYKALLDGKQVLVVCEQNDQDYADANPLTWEDPVKDNRPLFVLTNHSRYAFGDKDAEDTAWDLLKAAVKWDDDWLEEEVWVEGAREEGGHWDDNPDYINTGDGLPAIIKAADRVDAHVMPVYMYEHSGIWLSLGRDYPFNCPWDAGTLGIMLWTREQQDKYEEEIRRFNGDDSKIKDARAIMKSYFETYNKYVTGDVYCLTVYDVDQELAYLSSKHGLTGDDPALTLDDLNKWDLEFVQSQADTLESCGGFYLDDKYGPVEAATEHFNLEDMEELQ